MTRKIPAELKPLLVFPHPNVPSLADIGDGIIFIYAPWSGPAVTTYRLMISALVQTGCKIPIYLFNADDVDYLNFAAQYKQDLQRYGGWGETLLIKDRRVILEASSKTPQYQKTVADALLSAYGS
jgi:hypothetical protein